MSGIIDIRPLNPKDTEFVDLIRSRVQSLKFVDKDNGIDVLTLNLENNDRALSDSTKATAGIGILIAWGDAGNMTPLREITFTKVVGKGKIVTYEGKGKLWKTDHTPVYRRWDEIEVSELVRKIAREMGFNNPDIAGLETEFIIEQQNTSNSRFLAKVAREMGVAFWVDNRNLHFRSRDVVTPTRLQLVYKGTIEGSGYGRIIGEPSIGFEYSRNKPKTVTNTTTPKVVAPGIKVVFKKAPNGSTVPVVVRDYDAINKSRKVDGSKQNAAYCELKDLPSVHADRRYIAKAMFRKTNAQWQNKSRDKQKGEIPIHGDASLYPGDTVELYNYGVINEGKWYTRVITHNVTRSQFTQVLGVSRSSGKKGSTNVKGKVEKTNKNFCPYPRQTPGVDDNGKWCPWPEKEERKLTKAQHGTEKTVYKNKRKRK